MEWSALTNLTDLELSDNSIQGRRLSLMLMTITSEVMDVGRILRKS